MFAPQVYGYDRAITIFSPEGELYQVRYAGEAVKRGWATLGIKCVDGVVLAAEKRKVSSLIDLDSIEKVYVVDEHVGIAASGLLSDARVLIEYARQEAQTHRLLYDEPIDVELLTKRISDLKQIYTQHGGVRPFGAALIIGGVDRHGPRLFQTDPGGIYFGFYAVAMGAESGRITEFLEKEYKYNMSLDDCIKLSIRALSLVLEAQEPDRLEIGVVDVKTRQFRKLTQDEVRKYLEAVKGEATKGQG
ncbi:archaeal proteasome endopeptidase complex subunit alpha [Vulcanisaeta thermophila]|uniref:archaeal proteasome endopeptidase complex subunit alpha n=1 Tax=Vulcanisaeta thermophila TaxID=867917 RepID=UPI0008534D3A|nr:archaeal proteasome endopeptidase complex subunit alpha [Vulcanisaeta thermophila]